MKLFGLWDTSEIKIEDPSLRKHINVEPRLIPKSLGKFREKFGKTKVNIVERLINELSVPGHRGKKHKIMTRVTGKYTQQASMIIRAFKIIEERTKENPIQVLVKAIENASPRDEVTTIEYGGARYPQAVDISPERKISLALRNIVHGSQDKAFGKKKSGAGGIAESLANELILAANKSNESFSVNKKVETEKQADAAR
jgi:small subunit ribosomal protein S7